MTLYQFKMLDEMEQIETVWNSVLLAKMSNDQYEFELYQIDGFYVELRYLKDEKGLNQMKTFNGPNLLQPYFHLINVKKLIDILSK